MLNILLAFITGLTTGGLSCLAVQGGLLASSLAGQIEQDFQIASTQTSHRRRKKENRPSLPDRTQLSRPILAFLAAKLLAYTLLGGLLGWAGQMFQLSFAARAALQIAIGVFMLGTAMRMLNVHPVFRYFVIEPPAFLRRRLRKMTTGSPARTLSTPIFLGLLTVLIPCGITQAMMAAALSTSSPVQGAALLFAFTLGTSPVFFAVAYLATQLGSKLEKSFIRIAAIVILILGLVAIDNGITLAGSPVSITRLINAATTPATAPASPPVALELKEYQPLTPAEQGSESNIPAGENVVTIHVINTGYDPNVISAKAGVPLRLRLVSEGVYSCSLAFVIPSLQVGKVLEPTGEAWIDIPAQKKGTRMPFSCSMGMYTGVIVFDV